MTDGHASVSVPHASSASAPVLVLHGRCGRMVPLRVSIAILNHIADPRLVLLNNCGQRPPFEKPAEWTAQVLGSLKAYQTLTGAAVESARIGLSPERG